ncbi:MAG TPA: radical SAM protein [Syntrophobacter fumaroxidans]|nr:radical SAM protein [Syntrophobacter fumaroxidans]
MRILLINPSWGGRLERQRYNRAWPPLDLLYAASRLRDNGWDVHLCDARASGISPESAASRYGNADLVVVSSSPLDRWQCPNLDLDPLLAWTRVFQAERLIVYGVHPTLFPEAVLDVSGARAVLRGEPEDTLPALCSALAGDDKRLESVPGVSYRAGGRTIHTPAAAPVDLSALPLPAYDLTVPRDYGYELLGANMAVLETARGCPHSCTFCLKAMYGHGMREKNTAQVAAEVALVGNLGYRFIYFIDLELCLKRHRTLELCGIMRRSRLPWACQTRVDDVEPELLGEMAASGCRLIHFGIESGASGTHRRLRKSISVTQTENAVRWAKAAGIATAGFFLLGFPWETPKDWLATESLARRLNLTYASFHRVTPYPGTKLGEMLDLSGPWWENADAARIDDARLKRIVLRYCLRPSYIAEFLRRGTNRLAAVGLFLEFLKGFRARLPRISHSGSSRKAGR